MKKKELKYFKTIRDYFEIFLPNQKGASYHTIKNYKICMNQFLDFAKDYLGIKLGSLTPLCKEIFHISA